MRISTGVPNSKNSGSVLPADLDELASGDVEAVVDDEGEAVRLLRAVVSTRTLVISRCSVAHDVRAGGRDRRRPARRNSRARARSPVWSAASLTSAAAAGSRGQAAGIAGFRCCWRRRCVRQSAESPYSIAAIRSSRSPSAMTTTLGPVRRLSWACRRAVPRSFLYSLKVTFNVARTGTPSSRNIVKRWLRRSMTARKLSGPHTKRTGGGACSSGSISSSRAILLVSMRTSEPPLFVYVSKNSSIVSVSASPFTNERIGFDKPGSAALANWLPFSSEYSAGLKMTSARSAPKPALQRLDECGCALCHGVLTRGDVHARCERDAESAGRPRRSSARRRSPVEPRPAWQARPALALRPLTTMVRWPDRTAGATTCVVRAARTPLAPRCDV